MRESGGSAAQMGENWAEIYRRRRDRVREAMRQEGYDALLITSAPNRFYLSGFELHDGQPGESAGVLVITSDGADWLATDDRFFETASSLWAHDRIFFYGGKRRRNLPQLLPQCGSIMGFEADAVSVDWLQSLRRQCPATMQLLPTWGIVGKMRMVKEPCELEAMQRSYQLNHAMLHWLEHRLRAGDLTGMSEKQLAWEVERYFRERGASELAFAVIAASGKNGATPHAVPGAQVIGPETPLLMDVGCRVANYCSDQTRSWWNGNQPSREFSRCLALTQEAQQAAMAMMRPGVRCADVYQAANEVFERAGVADAFTHGLGHGIGLETHEAPSLSPRSEAVLLPGMTVTVEPGLYYPAWGGVRWEHTVVIESDGVRVL